MPRLTTQDFLLRRQFLREQWFECNQQVFYAIPTSMQRDLHDYFAVTEPLNDNDALLHRNEMTKAFPSLPQKAGRAYEALVSYVEDRPNKVVQEVLAFRSPDPSLPGKPHPIRASFLARPKIDTRRLAYALMELARTPEGQKLYENIKRQKARKPATSD